MNLKLSLRMPCCGNVLLHGDCTKQDRMQAASEGYIV